MPVPPKADPVRRNRRVGHVLLPAGGREGDPPPWPLSPASAEEVRAWADLWRTPHAVAWERMGVVRVVARYCRALVQAERLDASAALLGEVRQLEDRLGLTPKAMRLLLWEVAESEPVAPTAIERGARRRIKAV